MRSDDNDFTLRPGKIGNRGGGQPKSFFNEVMKEITKQSGGKPVSSQRMTRLTPGRSSFGKGRNAYGRSLFSPSSRRVSVKARVVRHHGKTLRSAPLTKHISYLKREGVTKDNDRAILFDAGGDQASEAAFAERCADDRHHFRFIISPEDAAQMEDLRGFTRDLAAQMETDLGSKLDWVAIDHWNTDNPHIHFLVRGIDDRGEDLVISRDYISRGLRSRAEDLATIELGIKPEQEIHASLEREATADRWTSLDREIMSHADDTGFINLRPITPGPDDSFMRRQMIRRLQYLESMGLATTDGSGLWRMSIEAESRLRDLGLRGDIIKTMHRTLTEKGLNRAFDDYVINPSDQRSAIIGRLVSTGLHDELSGEAYAIIDGVDGRAHHVRFKDLDAFDHAPPFGGIVEVRCFGSINDPKPTLVLANRSDLDITLQVTAPGATWLDHRLVERAPMSLSSSGFGQEVRQAMHQRANNLIEIGLAYREGERVRFRKDLLTTLRNQELETVGTSIAQQRGMTFNATAPGSSVSGTFRETLRLSSGRFALLDDGLGFRLVPWASSLEKHKDQQISGIARSDGGIDWRRERERGLGR